VREDDMTGFEVWVSGLDVRDEKKIEGLCEIFLKWRKLPAFCPEMTKAAGNFRGGFERTPCSLPPS
jgi:hypothetical protein